MAMQKWILEKIKKPCPFCGNTSKLEITSAKTFHILEKKSPETGACIRISCKNCDVDVYDHTSEVHDYKQRVQFVVDKWNRRAGE